MANQSDEEAAAGRGSLTSAQNSASRASSPSPDSKLHKLIELDDDDIQSICRRVRGDEVRVADQLANFNDFIEEHKWQDVKEAKAYEHELRFGPHRLLPGRDVAGRPVITFEWDPSRWPSHFSIERMQAACLALVLQVLHNDPIACERGVTILVDFGGASTQQVSGITSADRSRGWALLRGSIPVRVASIVIVNESLPLDMLLWAMRPFVSSKIWGRLHRCGGDLQAAAAHIPVESLPQSLGGELSEEELQASWESLVCDSCPESGDGTAALDGAAPAAAAAASTHASPLCPDKSSSPSRRGISAPSST